MPTYEAMQNGYRNLWAKMKVTRPAECDKAARKILAGRSRYEEVERATGVPWFFVGLLHMRESANNFAGVLHNGEHIIGTGQKTSLVPAGRGPFRSWSEAAVDALKLKGLQYITSWPVERIGYEAERFNGFGYISYAVNSPYVWAGSTNYTRGKYIADGRFDANHIDQQLGVMPVLAVLCKLSPDVNKRVNGTKNPTSEIVTTVGTGGTAVAVGVQQGWGLMQWGTLALVAAIAIVLIVAIIRKKKKDPADLPPVTDDTSIDHSRGGAAVQEN